MGCRGSEVQILSLRPLSKCRLPRCMRRTTGDDFTMTLSVFALAAAKTYLEPGADDTNTFDRGAPNTLHFRHIADVEERSTAARQAGSRNHRWRVLSTYYDRLLRDPARAVAAGFLILRKRVRFYGLDGGRV